MLDWCSCMFYDVVYVFLNGESFRVGGCDVVLMCCLVDCCELMLVEVVCFLIGVCELFD